MRYPRLIALVLLAACGGGDDDGGDPVEPLQLFTLTVIGSGSGEGRLRSTQGADFDCALGGGQTCSASVQEDTELGFEAIPYPSADFKGWESDASACGPAATCIVKMDRPLTLIARFELKVSGSWSGPIREQRVTVARLDLTLNEADGTVTGEGTLGNAGGAIPVAATGTYDVPNVSLTLSSEGLESVSLTAVVGKTEMRGTLSGSGFTERPIKLTRQE